MSHSSCEPTLGKEFIACVQAIRCWFAASVCSHWQRLHLAGVLLGDGAEAGLLCLKGADVNEADARGITALGLAVGYNKVALVKVLLEAGADVAKTDAKKSTVLHYAAGGPPSTKRLPVKSHTSISKACTGFWQRVPA